MESFGGYTENLRQFNVSNLRVSTSFRSNYFDPDTNCRIDFTQNRVINNIVKCMRARIKSKFKHW